MKVLAWRVESAWREGSQRMDGAPRRRREVKGRW